jgi:hypothetical protein
MTQSPQPSAEVPGILFDSYAVLKALDKKATARTSAENVCDVLDAVVRLLRAAPVPSPEAAPGAGEGKPFGWFYEMDSSANPKAGPTYLGSNDQKVTQLVADDEGATAFPLYATPPAAPEAITPAAEREPLTDDQLMAAMHSIGVNGQGRVSLTYESGPYDIDKPTNVAVMLCQAIERAHGIVAGTTKEKP